MLDQCEHIRGAARRIQPLIEVGDVRGDTGAPADVDGFAERIQKAVAQSIANVRVVDAAQSGRYFR